MTPRQSNIPVDASGDARITDFGLVVATQDSRTAMSAIAGGERPSRPTHPASTDKLLALVQRCWDQDAHRCPNVLQISCSLHVLVRNQVYLS